MTNTLDYITKKYSLNIDKQQFVEIHNMAGRFELASLFAELKFNSGAEIGVDRGYYSETLCQANPKLHLHSVDPWKPSVYEDKVSGMNTAQNYLDICYKEASDRLASYNCTIIRKTSMEALGDFKDNSLDYVYIDANHDFVNFTNDLHNWIKKVRPGGIVSGHDFNDYPASKFNHVKPALTAYASSYNISPIFIVVTHRKLLKDKRDKRYSWFWVKPGEEYHKTAVDDLTKLAGKYKTDRSPGSKHSYTPYYFDLFKKRRKSIKNVLEIGVGQGPGLRMWRDFFPNATIFGAEIDPGRIFSWDRIKVFLCDQSKDEDLKRLINKTGRNIDFVVDDASHKPEDQVFTCLTLMPLLNKHVIYIIEDVADLSIVGKLTDYNLEIPKLVWTKGRYDDRLVIVRHKND